MTQIGLALLPQFSGWEQWGRALQLAEDSGFQCVFAPDHFANPADHPRPECGDSLETWTALTYAADHTKRIELGSIVSPVTFRHPAMLARLAVIVDNLSHGRLVLGLGAGWQEWEHKTFGIPFYDVSTRFDRLAEALEITTRLFRSETPVSFQGKHFSLEEAVLLPRPSRKGGPPILIGGNGWKRTLPLAAQYANEWNAALVSVEVYKERAARLDELLASYGRKPGDVKRSLFLDTLLVKNEAELPAAMARWSQRFGQPITEKDLSRNGVVNGMASQWVEQLGQYAEAGVERILLRWPDVADLDGLALIARQVLPHFHRGNRI